jgi:hypothetical protein
MASSGGGPPYTLAELSGPTVGSRRNAAREWGQSAVDRRRFAGGARVTRAWVNARAVLETKGTLGSDVHCKNAQAMREFREGVTAVLPDGYSPQSHRRSRRCSSRSTALISAAGLDPV